MKQSLIIRVMFVCFIFVSCNTETLYFSCNPQIDSWVKENLESVNKMTRTDWSKMGDIAYQRAIYNAFSPEQRQKLWVEKFENALDLFSDKDEKSQLQLLLSSIKENPQWFDDNIYEATRDACEIFCYKWIYDARTALNWNSNTLYAIIGTPEDLIRTQQGDIIVNSVFNARSTVKSRSEGGYGKVCNCGNGSEYFTCSGWDGYTCNVDYNDPCRQTERGCGSIWQNACWGECNEPKIL